jgi:hypothetical protein
VKDPPTDLEEVVGGTQAPRVDKTLRDISGRFLQFIPIEPTPQTYVPPHREPTVACPLASEPTEALMGDHLAGPKPEIPGSQCHNPLSTK